MAGRMERGGGKDRRKGGQQKLVAKEKNLLGGRRETMQECDVGFAKSCRGESTKDMCVLGEDS